MKEDTHIRLAIFASGGGSNAKKIAEYFEDHSSIFLNLFVTNNPASGVVDLAKKMSAPVRVLGKEQIKDGPYLVEVLQSHKIDLIVLAGYIKYIPQELVYAFSGRILNIHPALLPHYGGKGMYGMNVHKAVHEAGDRKSGMSIHFVNEVYDDGEVIFQAEVELDPSWSPEEIGAAVLKLEHFHYPRVIENVCNSLIRE